MPERLPVPTDLLPATNASVASATGELLRGKCLVLLGDSTMTETAHDLAVLLFGLTGAAFDSYLRRATRMPSPTADGSKHSDASAAHADARKVSKQDTDA